MVKKRGQEEIVGFILIVVIITVAFVIFLGIRLRNAEPTQAESEIVYQFLESSMEQTTGCTFGENGRAIALDELIRECYSTNNPCIEGNTACSVAEGTMEAILNSTWKVGPEYPYKGYEIRADYSYNTSGASEEEIFSITAGNCSSSYTGNSYWIPEFPGTIIINAKLCS